MDIEIFRNQLLRNHTFYGVGGPIDELYKIGSFAAFEDIWIETLQQQIPFLLLGKGSNLLCSDKGFRGRVFVITSDHVQWLTPHTVRVDVGKNWQSFVEETNSQGLEDLCPLSGIPGNVGGFIRGNAGAFGLETADRLVSVEYLDEDGNVKTLTKDQCQFQYRHSIFKDHPTWCILRGTFAFKNPADPKESLQKTKDLMAERWRKYPPGRSGGSFFKNPEGDFAGRLLESVGAKGDRIGYAQVADKHANFIINLEGKALQEDILALARKWKRSVLEAHGITLEPEIFICDEWGQKIDLCN